MASNSGWDGPSNSQQNEQYYNRTGQSQSSGQNYSYSCPHYSYTGHSLNDAGQNYAYNNGQVTQSYTNTNSYATGYYSGHNTGQFSYNFADRAQVDHRQQRKVGFEI